MDAYQQIRRSDGSLPVRDVKLRGDELVFDIYTPTQYAKAGHAEHDAEALTLAVLVEAVAGPPEGLLTFARSMGPLFGMGAREDLASWRLAAHLAECAFRLADHGSTLPEELTVEDESWSLAIPLCGIYRRLLHDLDISGSAGENVRLHAKVRDNLLVASAEGAGASRELIVRALIAAHITDARLDYFHAGPATDHLAFPQPLAWMWYQHAQDAGGTPVGYCLRCGRPFSLRGGRGVPKRYCSEECKSSAKNERSHAWREDVRNAFWNGNSVAEIVGRARPGGTHTSAESVRLCLSNWDTLGKRLSQDVRTHGEQSELLLRCYQEGLDLNKLLDRGARRQLHGIGRKESR